jgi:hypothetical protein
MSDADVLPRFMVRRGTTDFMVWDRDRRGPATINNRSMTRLAKEEADALRDQLEMFYATSIGTRP